MSPYFFKWCGTRYKRTHSGVSRGSIRFHFRWLIISILRYELNDSFVFWKCYMFNLLRWKTSKVFYPQLTPRRIWFFSSSWSLQQVSLGCIFLIFQNWNLALISFFINPLFCQMDRYDNFNTELLIKAAFRSLLSYLIYHKSSGCAFDSLWFIKSWRSFCSKSVTDSANTSR